MKIIGLTGGIGSGKSTIAKMFEGLGVPVYYADTEAKKLMNRSAVIKNKLISVFGNEAYLQKELNRPFLANIVFNNPDKLQIINSIVHPEVERHFMHWVENQNFDYVIQENAIIFENNKENNFDQIITVTAPDAVKIERVMHRDNVAREKVLERMQHQKDDAYKIKHSGFVIHNLDLPQSEKEVFDIHKELLGKKRG